MSAKKRFDSVKAKEAEDGKKARKQKSSPSAGLLDVRWNTSAAEPRVVASWSRFVGTKRALRVYYTKRDVTFRGSRLYKNIYTPELNIYTCIYTSVCTQWQPVGARRFDGGLHGIRLLLALVVSFRSAGGAFLFIRVSVFFFVLKNKSER